MHPGPLPLPLLRTSGLFLLPGLLVLPPRRLLALLPTPHPLFLHTLGCDLGWQPVSTRPLIHEVRPVGLLAYTCARRPPFSYHCSLSPQPLCHRQQSIRGAQQCDHLCIYLRAPFPQSLLRIPTPTQQHAAPYSLVSAEASAAPTVPPTVPPGLGIPSFSHAQTSSGRSPAYPTTSLPAMAPLPAVLSTGRLPIRFCRVCGPLVRPDTLGAAAHLAT